MNPQNLTFRYISDDMPEKQIVNQYVDQEFYNAEKIVNFLYNKLTTDEMSDSDSDIDYSEKMEALYESDDQTLSYWGHYGEAMEGFKNCFEISSHGVALFYKGPKLTKDSIIIMFNVYHKKSKLYSTLEGDVTTSKFTLDSYFEGKDIYTQTHVGIHKPLRYNNPTKLRELNNQLPLNIQIPDKDLFTRLAMNLHLCALCYVHYKYYPKLEGWFLFAPTTKMRELSINFFGEPNIYSIKLDSINGEQYYVPTTDPSFMIKKTLSNDMFDCTNADIGIQMTPDFFNRCETYFTKFNV